LPKPPAPAAIFTCLEDRIPIRRHDHVAVLRHGPEAAFRLASFLSAGLRQGDWCYYLAAETFQAEMLKHLHRLAVDVDRHLREGTLRLQPGPTDFRELREWARQAFTEAERARAPAVRWLEEGIWPQPSGIPAPQFFEFHALLNYHVKTYPSVALCQYDVDRIEVRDLFGAIAVHRHLLVGDTLVRDNPFYLPAEKFIPLRPQERERDLLQLFREVGFEVKKLLSALEAYGRLQQPSSRDP
jgi:hypothetical protein